MEIEKTNEEKNQSLSSCEITTSTKGIFTFKVKVYDEDPEKAVEKAIQKSEELQKYCETKNISEVKL